MKVKNDWRLLCILCILTLPFNKTCVNEYFSICCFNYTRRSWYAFCLGSTKDVHSAYRDVSEAILAIGKSREDETVYSKLYSKMESLYGNKMKTPRLARAQTLRANHDTDSPYNYYRVAYFLPYVDHLMVDLQRRFANGCHLRKGMVSMHIASWVG